MKTLYWTIITISIAFTLTACTPESGSQAWCDSIKEKPKAEWTAEDAGIFTKHCVLGNYKK